MPNLPYLPLDHSQTRRGIVRHNCEKNGPNYQRLLDRKYVGGGVAVNYYFYQFNNTVEPDTTNP